jgi:hypothetical protein
LIQIKARWPAPATFSANSLEKQMTTGQAYYLVLVIAGFGFFGLFLAWHSYIESRSRKSGMPPRYNK